MTTNKATLKTLITKHGQSDLRHVDFKITDTKGRQIGLSIRTYMVTVTLAPEEAKSYYVNFDAPGDYIEVCMSATRNGKDYGASQPSDYFKTQEEADAAVAKRIESTRKRYAKQFS